MLILHIITHHSLEPMLMLQPISSLANRDVFFFFLELLFISNIFHIFDLGMYYLGQYFRTCIFVWVCILFGDSMYVVWTFGFVFYLETTFLNPSQCPIVYFQYAWVSFSSSINLLLKKYISTCRDIWVCMNVYGWQYLLVMYFLYLGMNVSIIFLNEHQPILIKHLNPTFIL